MTAFVIVACLVFLALVYVSAPAKKGGGRRTEEAEVSPGIEAARERKRLALGAILDMEEEREAGKLAEPDYKQLRARYEREALEALRELDVELTSRDAQIEAEIEKLKAASRCPECGALKGRGDDCDTCASR